MSRRSQAFASGQPSFSWRVERIEQPTDPGAGASAGRFKCSCKTHPDIFAFGDDEQSAIRAATVAMTKAVEQAKV